MNNPEQLSQIHRLETQPLPELAHQSILRRATENARAIGNRVLENMPNTARHPIAIGASALALAGGLAAANQLDGEPAIASNTPHAEATASDLRQDCVDAELVRPEVRAARMTKPGKPNQTAVVDMNFAETPEECRGVVTRNFQYEIIKKELLRVDGDLRHVTTRLSRWRDGYYTREEAGFIRSSSTPSGHNKWHYYHCSAGKAKTKLILKMRGTIKDADSHEMLKRQIWQKPFNHIDGKGEGC